jgi:hypothetical protein
VPAGFSPPKPVEGNDVFRILLRIVTVVSIMKLVAKMIGRRRDGGR